MIGIQQQKRQCKEQHETKNLQHILQHRTNYPSLTQPP
jgi:hypothetical protein